MHARPDNSRRGSKWEGGVGRITIAGSDLCKNISEVGLEKTKIEGQEYGRSIFCFARRGGPVRYQWGVNLLNVDVMYARKCVYCDHIPS